MRNTLRSAALIGAMIGDQALDPVFLVRRERLLLVRAPATTSAG
jgi:hypothetical protein